MGHKKLIIKCPCGKGGYIEGIKHYRNYNAFTYYNSCHICKENYEYCRGYWLTKDDYSEYQKLEEEFKNESESLYKYLYDKYFTHIVGITKTKKNLYEILNTNHLFCVGSLYAFYKNGIDSYIPSRKSLAASDFIKLIKLTNCLIDDDCFRIDRYQELETTIENYPKRHHY